MEQELLKARRADPSGSKSTPTGLGGEGDGRGIHAVVSNGGVNGVGGSTNSNRKRYLILTYAAEYDRVHYPLPLAYVDVPTREQLERTIDRLREVRPCIMRACK